MTKLSTLSLAILASSLSFAASYEGGADSMSFTMGAEVSGGLVDYGHGVVASGAAADVEEAKNVQALLNVSRIGYTEGNDKNLPLAFGGNVYFKTHIADSVKLMARFGLNTALKDGKSLLNVAGAEGGMTDGGVFKSKMSYEAAGFIGYEGIALGVAYDMRELEPTLSPAGVGTATTASFKENTVLFLARAESSYDAGDFTLNFGVEAANSFGRAADSEADTHYKNLVTQFALANGTTTAGLTASSVHTYLNKLSVFVGFDLYTG